VSYCYVKQFERAAAPGNHVTEISACLTYKLHIGNLEGKRSLERPRNRWEVNKMGFT
jgi:hypothetical protein